MSKRLLVVVPFAVLQLWGVAIELAAMVMHPALTADKVTMYFLVIGFIAGLSAVLIWGLVRGRRWAYFWAMLLGAVFSLPYLFKAPPGNVPLPYFGVGAGLLTLLGGALAWGSFPRAVTSAPAGPADGPSPLPGPSPTPPLL